MIFIIRRVSQSDERQKPCEEAFRGELPIVETRKVSDPSKFNDDGWYKKGN